MCSSGVSTASTAPNIVLKGWLALIVAIENATSLDVIGTPSWKVACSTKFSVTDKPSSDTLQDFAKYGCGFQFSSKRSGVAKSCAPGAPVVIPDCTAGLRCLGVAPSDMIIVPPCLGVSACTLTADNARTAAPIAATNFFANNMDYLL